jgi:hypothetical protein
MIKLLSLIAFVAFLFASLPSGYDLVVNSRGVLQLVKTPLTPRAENVKVAPTLFAVEANCNSPPASI